MTIERPRECCGVCPPVTGGGFDCTCRNNPRCPNYAPLQQRSRNIQALDEHPSSGYGDL